MHFYAVKHDLYDLYTKHGTSIAFSNFREFLKNKNSLESLNVIFRIS